MFQKKKTSEDNSSQPSNTNAPVRFAKPKILLLDMPAPTFALLKRNGFNVEDGTLGKPYRVNKSSSYMPLMGTWNAPNYSEQEVVFIDLAFGLLSQPEGVKPVPNEEPDFWGKCDKGFLDPRVRASYQLKSAFNRIFNSGGIFIVFADAQTNIEIQIATNKFNSLQPIEECRTDAWGFLSELTEMSVYSDAGLEMHAVNSDRLGVAIAPYLKAGQFTCTLRGGYPEGEWKLIATNKYGHAVGLYKQPPNKGLIVVLPQIHDKSELSLQFLQEILPELTPRFFPENALGRWLSWDEYELPEVKKLKRRQLEIRADSEQRISELEVQIANRVDSDKWVQGLLAATDTELVDSVKRAFDALGFKKIVDVDEELDKQQKPRREDLQIDDGPMTLIIDVKGISGIPSDDDALQAFKHASIRMREWSRFEVQGLSLINHQRHIPPLDRENGMPFRQELLDAAGINSMGLMTCFDLYRVVRNAKKLGWTFEQVIPIFYGYERLSPVPNHYKFIGTIEKVWTDKFGVIIESDCVEVGDRIAVEFPIEFEEIEIRSIHVEGKSVARVDAEQPAGFLWPNSLPPLRQGMKVYVIHRVMQA